MCRDLGGCGSSCSGLCGGTYGSVPYQLQPDVTTFATPPVGGGFFLSNGPNTTPYFSPTVPFAFYLNNLVLSPTAGTPLIINTPGSEAGQITNMGPSGTYALIASQTLAQDTFLNTGNSIAQSTFGTQADGKTIVRSSTTAGKIVLDAAASTTKLQVTGFTAGVLQSSGTGDITSSNTVSMPAALNLTAVNNIGITAGGSLALSSAGGNSVTNTTTNGTALTVNPPAGGVGTYTNMLTGVQYASLAVKPLAEQCYSGIQNSVGTATWGIETDGRNILRSSGTGGKIVLDAANSTTKLQVTGFGLGALKSDASGNISSDPAVKFSNAGTAINVTVSGGDAGEVITMGATGTYTLISNQSAAQNNYLYITNASGASTFGTASDGKTIIRSANAAGKIVLDAPGATTKLQITGLTSGFLASDSSGNISIVPSVITTPPQFLQISGPVANYSFPVTLTPPAFCLYYKVVLVGGGGGGGGRDAIGAFTGAGGGGGAYCEAYLKGNKVIEYWIGDKGLGGIGSNPGSDGTDSGFFVVGETGDITLQGGIGGGKTTLGNPGVAGKGGASTFTISGTPFYIISPNGGNGVAGGDGESGDALKDNGSSGGGTFLCPSGGAFRRGGALSSGPANTGRGGGGGASLSVNGGDGGTGAMYVTYYF